MLGKKIGELIAVVAVNKLVFILFVLIIGSLFSNYQFYSIASDLKAKKENYELVKNFIKNQNDSLLVELEESNTLIKSYKKDSNFLYTQLRKLSADKIRIGISNKLLQDKIDSITIVRKQLSNKQELSNEELEEIIINNYYRDNK